MCQEFILTFLSGVQADLDLFPSMNPKATCMVSLLGTETLSKMTENQ